MKNQLTGLVVALMFTFTQGGNGPEYQYVDVPTKEIQYPTYTREELEQIVINAAVKHDVPVELAFAFVQHESGWNWLAANNKTKRENSLGLFQIFYVYHWERCGVDSAEQMKLPHVNADCGVSYIRQVMNRVDSMFMSFDRAKENIDTLAWYVRLTGCGYNGSPKLIQKRGGDVVCTNANASNYGRALASKVVG